MTFNVLRALRDSADTLVSSDTVNDNKTWYITQITL